MSHVYSMWRGSNPHTNGQSESPAGSPDGTPRDAARLPADPRAFVAETERAANEGDLETIVGIYAENAALELSGTAGREHYRGLGAIQLACGVYLAGCVASGLRLRKRFLVAAGDTIINEWHGQCDGRDLGGGVEYWRFDAAGKVCEHRAQHGHRDRRVELAIAAEQAI